VQVPSIPWCSDLLDATKTRFGSLRGWWRRKIGNGVEKRTKLDPSSYTVETPEITLNCVISGNCVECQGAK
jgi:hypothetical protein